MIDNTQNLSSQLGLLSHRKSKGNTSEQIK